METTTPNSPAPFGPGYSVQRYASERAIMASPRPQGTSAEAWRQCIKAQSGRLGTATGSGS